MSNPGTVDIHGRRLKLTSRGLKVDDRYMPLLDLGGTVYYVSSVLGASTNDGMSPLAPVSTIAAAVSLCTASNNDIIVVMQKHAETITAAAGIALSKAGVTLIGVGNKNQRPTITFTTANTATMTVSAADVYIENILFVGNFLSIATAIDVSATGFTAVNCEFRDTDASHGFLVAVKATGAANTSDGLTLRNCFRYGLSTTGGAFVSIVDDIARMTLLDNVSISAGTSSCFYLSAGSKIATGANIGRNYSQVAATSGNLFISNGGATNTGLVYDNYNGNLDVTGAQTFGAATGLQFFNNQSTSTSTEAGALAQTADTPLS